MTKSFNDLMTESKNALEFEQTDAFFYFVAEVIKKISKLQNFNQINLDEIFQLIEENWKKTGLPIQNDYLTAHTRFNQNEKGTLPIYIKFLASRKDLLKNSGFTKLLTKQDSGEEKEIKNTATPAERTLLNQMLKDLSPIPNPQYHNDTFDFFIDAFKRSSPECCFEVLSSIGILNFSIEKQQQIVTLLMQKIRYSKSNDPEDYKKLLRTAFENQLNLANLALLFDLPDVIKEIERYSPNQAANDFLPIAKQFAIANNITQLERLIQKNLIKKMSDTFELLKLCIQNDAVSQQTLSWFLKQGMILPYRFDFNALTACSPKAELLILQKDSFFYLHRISYAMACLKYYDFSKNTETAQRILDAIIEAKPDYRIICDPSGCRNLSSGGNESLTLFAVRAGTAEHVAKLLLLGGEVYGYLSQYKDKINEAIPYLLKRNETKALYPIFNYIYAFQPNIASLLKTILGDPDITKDTLSWFLEQDINLKENDLNESPLTYASGEKRKLLLTQTKSWFYPHRATFAVKFLQDNFDKCLKKEIADADLMLDAVAESKDSKILHQFKHEDDTLISMAIQMDLSIRAKKLIMINGDKSFGKALVIAGKMENWEMAELMIKQEKHASIKEYNILYDLATGKSPAIQKLLLSKGNSIHPITLLTSALICNERKIIQDNISKLDEMYFDSLIECGAKDKRVNLSTLSWVMNYHERNFQENLIINSSTKRDIDRKKYLLLLSVAQPFSWVGEELFKIKTEDEREVHCKSLIESTIAIYNQVLIQAYSVSSEQKIALNKLYKDIGIIARNHLLLEDDTVVIDNALKSIQDFEYQYKKPLGHVITFGLFAGNRESARKEMKNCFISLENKLKHIKEYLTKATTEFKSK